MTANFCIHSSKGPDIIMHQLKSSYNSPLKDSYLHPIHTCFAMIASNDEEIRVSDQCSRIDLVSGVLYN